MLPPSALQSGRFKGRSYIGVLDDDQSSLSLLDIPFTVISNITLGSNCACIFEGGSALLPLSVAKLPIVPLELFLEMVLQVPLYFLQLLQFPLIGGDGGSHKNLFPIIM
ncbi:uncharacterized protein LOC110705909 [Chenopodium quinoa]|uniref:uncharacterized protein LOC110705909 n=1 Tax=Chenopodium quinoa TaxID=63459 RepID=UPI000B786D30|nr:uncharacterized protein LOC110705909 [Chenopodium quinoa]